MNKNAYFKMMGLQKKAHQGIPDQNTSPQEYRELAERGNVIGSKSAQKAVNKPQKTFLQLVRENQASQKAQETKRNAFLSGKVSEDAIKSPEIRTAIQATTPEARFNLLTGRYKPDTLPSQFREALNAAAKKDLNIYNNYKNKGWWERFLAWFQQMYARFSGGNEGATLRGGAQNAKNRFLQYFAQAPTAAQNKLI